MSIAWNDPQIGIDWPIGEPIVSAKDRSAPTLDQITRSRLPVYRNDSTATAIER
jgi:dTDP-4-dehydrorhamnose 3,5-epimerase